MLYRDPREAVLTRTPKKIKPFKKNARKRTMDVVNGRHLSDSTEKQKDTSQGLKAEQVIMTSVLM